MVLDSCSAGDTTNWIVLLQDGLVIASVLDISYQPAGKNNAVHPSETGGKPVPVHFLVGIMYAEAEIASKEQVVQVQF